MIAIASYNEDSIAAQYNTKLVDVPLGSEVEFEDGSVATVIGRRSTKPSTKPFFGWNESQPKLEAKYPYHRQLDWPNTLADIRERVPGYDFIPNYLDYKHITGGDYADSDLKVKVKRKPMAEKKALKDLPLGTVVKLEHVQNTVATIIARADGMVFLGSRDRSSNYLYQQQSYVDDLVSRLGAKSLPNASKEFPYTRHEVEGVKVEVVSLPQPETSSSPQSTITHPNSQDVSNILKELLYLGIVRPSELADESKRLCEGSVADFEALKQVVKEAKEEEAQLFEKSLKDAQDLVASFGPNVKYHTMSMEEFQKLVDKFREKVSETPKPPKEIDDAYIDQMANEVKKIWDETLEQAPTTQQRVATMPTPEEKTYSLTEIRGNAGLEALIGAEVECPNKTRTGAPSSVSGTIVGYTGGYYAIAGNSDFILNQENSHSTSGPTMKGWTEANPQDFSSDTFKYKHIVWINNLTKGCKLLRPSPGKFKSLLDVKKSEEQTKVQDTQTNQKETVMSNTTTQDTKPSFWDTMKNEGKEAGWRVASTQIMKAAKTGILAALRSKGTDGGKLAAIAEFLDTEIGNAIISGSLGHVLPHLPGNMGKDPRVQKLAKEFRVQGYTTVGNEIVGTAMEHILPAITTALQALPKDGEETATKTRVVHDEVGSEENEESEETNGTKKAAVSMAHG